MLGYTEAEVRKMIACVSICLNKTGDNQVEAGLLDAIDLMQGLLEEGRI